MSTKSKTKQAIEETFDAAKDAALKTLEKAIEPVDDGRLDMKNSDGGMLMCKMTIGSREGAPDPLCITVNDEIRWVKRNKEVVVPWYVVLHMKNNIETRFKQEKDDQGKRIVVGYTGPSEPVSYVPISPASDNPHWL